MKETTNPARIKAAKVIMAVWVILLVFIVVGFASTLF